MQPEPGHRYCIALTTNLVIARTAIPMACITRFMPENAVMASNSRIPVSLHKVRPSSKPGLDADSFLLLILACEEAVKVKKRFLSTFTSHCRSDSALLVERLPVCPVLVISGLPGD